MSVDIYLNISIFASCFRDIFKNTMSVTRTPSDFYESARANRSQSSTPNNASCIPHRSSNYSHPAVNETPVTSRRTDTVVVTSDETDKMFDCFNSITRALKHHKMLLHNIDASQRDLEEKVQGLRENEKIDNLVEQENNDDGKIPPEISVRF